MQSSLADLIDTELVKRWHQRRCVALNDLYEAWRDTAKRQYARLAVWLAGGIYVLFSVTDAILIEDVLYYAFASRCVLAIVSVGVVDAQLRRRALSSTIDLSSAVIVVAGYSGWLWITSYSDHHLGASYYITFGIVFMMISSLFFNLSFKLALSVSSIILTTFTVSIFTIFTVSHEYMVAIGMLYASSYILTLFVNWKLNEERYRVFLNSTRAEIRQTEIAERGAALLRLSTTDALTGLANRRSTDDELRTLWDGWQQAGRSFGVVLIDIDYFKRFNDHYGHQEGDRCLVAAAEAMAAAAARHEGMIGRFGGEEFILLIRSQSRDHVAMVAEELRRAVEELGILHDRRPDRTGVVTVSVGAAFSPDIAGAKAERLVTEADRALYVAKADDRNCVRVFDRDDPRKVDENESVVALLRGAIAQGRVTLAYQPIRDVRSGAIVAVEALMRLTAANGKAISPTVFIPVAERTGAIVELGQWAIRTACRDVIATGLVPAVSVNVSAVQLKTPGFALSVAAILGETGVAPGRLAVEVTEGLAIETDPEILRSLEDLKRLGVRIWLDDFGTGFAGLSCLRQIDFDIVKIDRSFLHARQTPRGAALLWDIVGLVRNAGHATIVEGVETAQHLDGLDRNGVDLVQGYHLGRPMAAELLARLVGEEHATPADHASA